MGRSTVSKQRRKSRKQDSALRQLRELMPDLPEDMVPALMAARAQLGMKRKTPKVNSQSSVMAHFNVIFARLGRKKRTGLVNRKPTRTATLDVTSPAFLRSYEWRRLRMRALKHYGAVCMCCGQTEGPMNVDHIKPRKKYPELALEFDNLQVLCGPCNHGKGNWDETDWRPKLGESG